MEILNRESVKVGVNKKQTLKRGEPKYENYV